MAAILCCGITDANCTWLRNQVSNKLPVPQSWRFGFQLQGAPCSLPSPRGQAPCFLDPLVEGIGMLGEFLAQFVILLLPPLFLLQLQFSFLRQKGGGYCYLLLLLEPQMGSA